MTDGNGSSYQKADDNGGSYQAVSTNGNGHAVADRPKYGKKILLVGIAAAAAVIIGLVASRKPTSAIQDNAVASAGLATNSKTGKLKLFDKFSK